MPLAAPTPCRHPGCGRSTTTGYCAAHTTVYKGATRGTAAQRGYDAAWRRLRARVLKEEPLCSVCAKQGKVTAATVGDHIVSISVRPDLRLARSNVRPLCKPCHDRHTRASQYR